jgi:16S rRNA (cytosine1402-N4)-methyltransferase
MHVPVLQSEVIEYLDPKPNENFVDGTINGGGHARLILDKIRPRGRIIGIDLTPELIVRLKRDLITEGHSQRVVLINDNFARLEDIVRENKFHPVNGLILDLGFSSWHLEQSGRGFSFMANQRLDMRFNPREELNAWTIINRWSEDEIGALIRDYGQENFWRKIAANIVADRQLNPIDSTKDLAQTINKSVPEWYRHRKIHPATKTFQALRIVVNRELSNLVRVLPQAISILAPEGRIVIISFHELEDRIVKQFFKTEEEAGRIELITKRPVKPSEKEIAQNRRSRSARLRAARKI